MEQYVFWAATFVIGGVFGLLSYYFKKNEDRLDKKDKELQGQIETLKKDLADYKLEAQREFAAKDEFIRAISNHDKKLDKIYDEVMRISGRNGDNAN